MSDKFKEIYRKSIIDPESFWREASDHIFWFKKHSKILNKSNPPFYKWFEDGVTNSCYNALYFNIDKGKGKKTALIYWPHSFVVRDRLDVVDSLGNVYAGGPSHRRNR